MVATKSRKAMIREYKESYRPVGVFCLRNKTNDKRYVASTPNLPARFNSLRMQLNNRNFLLLPQLQKDWSELGEDQFELTVLAELEPPDAPGWDPSEDLKALEALWLEELKPWGDRGYNRPPK